MWSEHITNATPFHRQIPRICKALLVVHGPVLAARVCTCSKMASDIHDQISVASQNTAAPECTIVVRVARLQARYLLDWPFLVAGKQDAGWIDAAMHERRNSGCRSARASLNAPAPVESVEVDLSGTVTGCGRLPRPQACRSGHDLGDIDTRAAGSKLVPMVIDARQRHRRCSHWRHTYSVAVFI